MGPYFNTLDHWLSRLTRRHTRLITRATHSGAHDRHTSGGFILIAGSSDRAYRVGYRSSDFPS